MRVPDRENGAYMKKEVDYALACRYFNEFL